MNKKQNAIPDITTQDKEVDILSLPVMDGVLPVPDGVTEIGADAFKGCSKLEEIFIPHKVQEIGNEAFANCPNLRSVKISREFKSRRKEIFGKDIPMWHFHYY